MPHRRARTAGWTRFFGVIFSSSSLASMWFPSSSQPVAAFKWWMSGWGSLITLYGDKIQPASRLNQWFVGEKRKQAVFDKSAGTVCAIPSPPWNPYIKQSEPGLSHSASLLVKFCSPVQSAIFRWEWYNFTYSKSCCLNVYIIYGLYGLLVASYSQMWYVGILIAKRYLPINPVIAPKLC